MNRQQILRRLKRRQRQHKEAGFDCDYLEKLSDEHLEWMLNFVVDEYDGGASDPDRKKLVNRHRYMARHADAMGITVDDTKQVMFEDGTEGEIDLIEVVSVEDITPESHLLLEEKLSDDADPDVRRRRKQESLRDYYENTPRRLH